MVVSTDIVGLGLIGFSVNCLMVVFNTIGIEKKDTDKLAGGWGLAHLSLGGRITLSVAATFMNNPGPFPNHPRISASSGIALASSGFFWASLDPASCPGPVLRPSGIAP